VGQAVDQLADMAREYNVELVCELPAEPVNVAADATQLGVAVRALVVNALEALGDGGRVSVMLRETAAGDNGWAEIAVHDNGPGISDDVRRHMFDPFFSGREAGRGLGFGLSKCWRIVTDHGGRVFVERQSGGGTEMSIRLPKARPSAIRS
jgi:signal transduction histidine kinase